MSRKIQPTKSSGPHSRITNGQAPTRDTTTPQFDPWILWVTFRRCWPWAVPIGIVLSCVAGYVVLKTFVPRYLASHLLEANEDYIVFKGVMPTIQDISSSEQTLFFNAIILDPVLADPALRESPSLADPETAELNIRQNLSVSSGGTRSRLLVSYEDTDPEAAAMICNAIVDSYLRQRDAFDSTRVANLERWLGPEIERWQQEVEQRQRSVQKLSEQVLGFAPGKRLAVIEDESLLSLMAELRSQISDLSVQLAIEDANRIIASESTFVPPTDDFLITRPALERPELTETMISQRVTQDPKVLEATMMISRCKSIMIELELSDMVRISRAYYQETKAMHDAWVDKLNSIRSSARERAITSLNQEADEEFERQKIAFQTRLDAYKNELDSQRGSRMEAARTEWELQQKQKQAEAKRNRDAMASKLDVLQKQYALERSRLEQFGGVTAELQFAQEDLGIATSVLTKLRGRVAEIRTESRQDGAVRTLASATPPKSPVEAIPLKKMVMAAGGVFCIPFFFGLLWELRVQRLPDSSAIEKATSIAPVVGEIAKLPLGSQNTSGRRIFEESVDTLRANLLLSTETKHVRSIAVVSSVSGEGKSSVASQLAISIVKATGQNVLLVDADLRSPDQHDIFGLEIGPGLAAVLSQTATLDEAIDTSLSGLLHVMPAGQLDRSPHRLISQASMREFVAEALERYRFVVIDTAPVLAASESLAVASSVDSTLLCVMRDVSRRDCVNRSMRRLEAAGASIAGTVFSGVTASQYAFRYGNYHYTIQTEADA